MKVNADRIEDLVTQFMLGGIKGTKSAIEGPTEANKLRVPEFRASAFPFCPLLFSLAKAEQKEDYGSSFFFKIGTAIHELIQQSFPRGEEHYKPRMFGDWRCVACGKWKRASTKPEPCTCNEILAEWRYEELLVKWKNLSGHVDTVLKVDKKHYIVVDYKCLVGSTLVNTSNGFLEMKELGFKKGTNPFRTTIDSHEGNKQVTHSFKNRAKTISIRTANGFELEGTDIHPVLVFNDKLEYEWKKLKDIQLDDWIVSTSNKNKPIWPSQNLVSKDEAQILGWLTANASGIDEKSSATPYLHTDDSDLASRYKEAVIRVTGQSIKREHLYSNRCNVYTSNRKLHDRLLNLGYTGKNAAEKNIVKAVRSSSKEVMHAFLSAYFECDSGTGNGGITLRSASKKLIDQIHVILWHGYGILGRKYKHKSYATNSRSPKIKPYWSIDITGEDCLEFISQFPTSKVAKNHKEEIIAYATRNKKRPDVWRRYIPHVAGYHWNYLAQRKTNSKTVLFPNGTTGKAAGLYYFPRPQSSTGISKEVLEELGPYTSDYRRKEFHPLISEVLTKIENENIHFEKVVVIDKSEKKKWVYDVTVPEGHCFTANGLASHNTTNLSHRGKASSFPYGANVIQIMIYCTLLKIIYGINIVGWCLVYVDRTKPISGPRDFHPVANEWTRSSHKAMLDRLEASNTAYEAAAPVLRLRLRGIVPQREAVAKLVKLRPCRTKKNWVQWMIHKFYWEEEKVCPHLKRCTGCDDKKLTDYFYRLHKKERIR